MNPYLECEWQCHVRISGDNAADVRATMDRHYAEHEAMTPRGVDMNSPAKTHFTISPEEWMKLPKAKLWRDWGNAGDLHNLLDEYAVELEARVAVVRPTRDQIAQVVADAACNFYQVPVVVQDEDRWVADALIRRGFVAVSDSQETPTL